MLHVQDLCVSFTRYQGLMARHETRVLDGVDVDAKPGELLALVGQSGAGKSLFAHAVLGILPHNARVTGRIDFDGETLDARRQRQLRGKRIALVPQAVTWLDPTASAARQVAWGASAATQAADRHNVFKEFARYDLAEEAMDLFAHQLSGGMARRVLTAIATISRADLLIADEPTTGLDPQVCALALKLLRGLADQGHTVVVITHDLSAVLGFADRVAILQGGRTVEIIAAGAFGNGGLTHPYSQALRAALPEYGFVAAVEQQTPLSPGTPGCLHRQECQRASAHCSHTTPPWLELAHTRVRCHHV